MKSFTVGVDVGGTNIKFGLVNAAGRVIARNHLETKTFIRDKKKLIHAVIERIRDLIEDSGLTEKYIQGIGMGLPGPIDYKRGMVNFLPNIPGWENVPLKNLIEKKIGIPTFIDNDVNVITLGEWKYGAGRGYQNLLCMTLGTGVGGGLILDNSLYRGEGFAAGEIGHIPLNESGPKCPCGGIGCLERYVGNKKLHAEVQRIFKKKHIELPDIYPLAEKKDPRAVHFWKTTATHIGNALVGIVNVLNPPLIIIGGGVSNNFKFFHKTIVATIKRRAMRVQSKMVRIVRAELGDDAGIIGAYVLVQEQIVSR